MLQFIIVKKKDIFPPKQIGLRYKMVIKRLEGVIGTVILLFLSNDISKKRKEVIIHYLSPLHSEIWYLYYIEQATLFSSQGEHCGLIQREHRCNEPWPALYV